MSGVTPQDSLDSLSWKEVVCEGKDLQQEDKTWMSSQHTSTCRKTPLQPSTCLVPPAKDLAASLGPALTGSLFFFFFRKEAPDLLNRAAAPLSATLCNSNVGTCSSYRSQLQEGFCLVLGSKKRGKK